MKHIFGIILLSALVASCGTKGNEQASHQAHQPAAKVKALDPDAGITTISFDHEEFDFGTINEGQVVKHTFTFANTGDKPLIIQNATPSCGCTVPSWSKDPIAPGGKGEIEVSFDSKGKTNAQNRSVTVVANTEPPITMLKIKGMVIPKSDQAMGPVRRN